MGAWIPLGGGLSVKCSAPLAERDLRERGAASRVAAATDQAHASGIALPQCEVKHAESSGTPRRLNPVQETSLP